MYVLSAPKPLEGRGQGGRVDMFSDSVPKKSVTPGVTLTCPSYLTTMPTTYGDPLHAPFARDYAVRDYKLHLQTGGKRKPASVNLALAAIDHFYRFLGHPHRSHVDREVILQDAPRSLSLDEQKQLLRLVQRQVRVRDQALILLLFYTGLRVSECAALNLDDVPRSSRKGRVIIYAGKRGTYREVPLNTQVRDA